MGTSLVQKSKLTAGDFVFTNTQQLVKVGIFFAVNDVFFFAVVTTCKHLGAEAWEFPQTKTWMHVNASMLAVPAIWSPSDFGIVAIPSYNLPLQEQ